MPSEGGGSATIQKGKEEAPQSKKPEGGEAIQFQEATKGRGLAIIQKRKAEGIHITKQQTNGESPTIQKEKADREATRGGDGRQSKEGRQGGYTDQEATTGKAIGDYTERDG